MAELTETERAELADIAWHWETAYSFEAHRGSFTATRTGDPEAKLSAETVEELRELVRRDYMRWLATLKERSSL